MKCIIFIIVVSDLNKCLFYYYYFLSISTFLHKKFTFIWASLIHFGQLKSEEWLPEGLPRVTSPEISPQWAHGICDCILGTESCNPEPFSCGLLIGRLPELVAEAGECCSVCLSVFLSLSLFLHLSFFICDSLPLSLSLFLSICSSVTLSLSLSSSVTLSLSLSVLSICSSVTL